MCLSSTPSVQKPNVQVPTKDVDEESKLNKDKQKEKARLALGWQRSIGTTSRGASGGGGLLG